MKLNSLEFALMNNPVRAAAQHWIETPLLLAGAALQGTHVLEIGCGRGVGIEGLLAQGAARVTGVDLDPRMVRLARARLAHRGARATVLVASADALPVPDSSVDAVVDYGVIHHIPDWPQTLQEIARVLVPGGTFYFEDLLRGLIATAPMRRLFDHPQATQFTAPEFRAALEGCGLTVRGWREVGTLGIIGQATR